jgi:hypothetical protein
MYKVFSVCCIFTGCCLVTASNTVASSGSVFTSSLAGDCLTTNFYSSNCCLKTLLSRNHSCSSLYSLGVDRTENTSPNSSSIVASHSYHMDSTDSTASQLLHCCVLWLCCGTYIAMAVVQLLTLQSLPSNGSTCHSILKKKGGCVTVNTGVIWIRIKSSLVNMVVKIFCLAETTSFSWKTLLHEVKSPI